MTEQTLKEKDGTTGKGPGLAAKSDNPRSGPGTHVVKNENRLT